jgi:type I restriction enzyme, R subunit
MPAGIDEGSHHRLSVLRQQDLLLVRDGQQGLRPASDVGTRKARDKKEEFLSQIIARLNEIFVSDGLTENDLLDYARSITNKVSENEAVMHQIRNNSAEQALLGDFASAVDNAVMESGDAHQNQMNQVLSDKNVAAGFGRIVFDLLVARMKAGELGPGATELAAAVSGRCSPGADFISGYRRLVVRTSPGTGVGGRC